MQLFKNANEHLIGLKEKPFKLEKEIQNLFEQNLIGITGLTLIKSEFTIKNRRIDTLAFDPEFNAFVIIEYKRDKNYSVVDQGVSYLNLMLEYKAEFILEYNDCQEHHLKRSDIDWSQSKIMFVAPSFTQDQKQSTNFKDFTIELWEIKRFENDFILINTIQKSNSAPNLAEVRTIQDSSLSKLQKEIIQYDENYHLNDKSDEIKELYQEFKIAILDLADDIEIKATKVYIAFKKQKNLVDIAIQKNAIKIWINLPLGLLEDPRNLARDVKNIGHHGNGDYEIIIKNNEYKEYIMSLIKQTII